MGSGLPGFSLVKGCYFDSALYIAKDTLIPLVHCSQHRVMSDVSVCAAGVWLHGEAVSAGMVMAADMSRRLGWIEQDIVDRTRTLLQRAQLPVAPPQVSFPACLPLVVCSPFTWIAQSSLG